MVADWTTLNAGRYAELTLFDQELVTPAREIAMLDAVRLGEFNRFYKERIRWESSAVCAIGEGAALEAVRASAR